MRILSIAAMILFCTSCLAWSDTGHKAICEIAYQELDAAARVEVDRLIGADPEYQTFAESCVWADGPPRQRPPDHFMNFPRTAQAVTVADCVTAETCLFTAIGVDSRILAASGASDAERLVALKLLGHWLGDIHQPFHASFGDDRGANRVEAILEHNGESVDTNLHNVWDYWIVSKRLGEDYRVLATNLRRSVTDAERDQWRRSGMTEWANESFQIAITADTRYCVQQSGACWYSASNYSLDDGETRRQEALGEEYFTAHADNVRRRLSQAGIRLAALLNALLAP